jgi:hypothetical protein
MLGRLVTQNFPVTTAFAERFNKRLHTVRQMILRTDKQYKSTEAEARIASLKDNRRPQKLAPIH